MLERPPIPLNYSEYFTSAEIHRGANYANQKRVTDFSTEPDPDVPDTFKITAKVQGRRPKPYSVTIYLSEDYIDGNCSCPMGYNCKHVMAALLCWDTESPFSPGGLASINLNERIDYKTSSWISSAFSDHLAEPTSYFIKYRLSKPDNDSFFERDSCLRITVYRHRRLKNGGIGKGKPFSPSGLRKGEEITFVDQEILALLEFMETSHYQEGVFQLKAGSSSTLLEKLIATGHCYWESNDDEPLSLSNHPLSATLTWQLTDNGSQQVTCFGGMGQPLTPVLALQRPYYVDLSQSTLHPLTIDLPNFAIHLLLTAPVIEPSQVRNFVSRITQNLPENISIPLPQVFQTVTQKNMEPTLQLNIEKGENGSASLPRLELFYDKHLLPSDSSSSALVYAEGDTLVQIPRKPSAEASIYQDLATQAKTKGIEINNLLETPLNDLRQIVYTGETLIPQLEEAGLTVNFDSSQFYNLLELDEWYTDLDTESENGWFDLDMGVFVNGEKVSLLPHILDAIKHLKSTPKGSSFYLELDQGKVLPLPVERLQSIANTITQFIDPNRLTDSPQSLKISRYKASLLAEIEKAFQATEMRWIGGENLRKLGKKLKNFRSIKQAKPPKALFQAELRKYQQQGVNWLQFLREYDLNGILADDMGLGKTIQTLAHILIEKKKGRLTKPCLIIAPTSVIYNWKNESQRFTPSLSILVLRGKDRLSAFKKVPDHDIVLTTYPLVTRDKEKLLEHTYHLLILDEAQTIKNSQAKMTQVVQQLKAKHRLCLTGTPLENNLGEFWSLFHFLMPGLLGNRAYFKKEYQNPIEKERNKEKLSRLVTITRPFLLRRTKKEVVKDLPPKTEIIKKIIIDSKQRDLYESIRLAMHKKVRDAIDSKGVERCQIVILDALLKLRQACCDPALVKLESAKKVKESAKMDMLFDMLQEMIPEGRRILLFSQFTSMLEIIEARLLKKKIAYVKLTGATSDRETPVETFQQGDAPIFLISLKSGGSGLNLTAADTVIHYDPWWNPAVESQATDRSYRIGQDKPVFVYKLVTEDTVEEKIVAMQEKKRSLMEALFSGKANQTTISKKDINFLLAKTPENQA